jgi:hypothetical protein
MSERNESNVRAADLAVERKMVDRSPADRALHLLEARDSQISVGELLLQLGHINAEQFKELMASLHASAMPNETAIRDLVFSEAVISRGRSDARPGRRRPPRLSQLAAKGPPSEPRQELLIVRQI